MRIRIFLNWKPWKFWRNLLIFQWILVRKPRRPQPVASSSTLKNGLKKNFDFSSVITIAGLWAIWQAYLVNILTVFHQNLSLLHFRLTQDLFLPPCWETFGTTLEISDELSDHPGTISSPQVFYSNFTYVYVLNSINLKSRNQSVIS